MLQALGQREEAVEMFRAVLRIDPTRRSASDLGETLRHLGRYDEALEALDQALKVDPKNANALGTRGQVLQALGRREEAVDALRKALVIDPKLSWVYSELGRTLRLLGRDLEALAEFDRALASDPSNIGARLGLCEVLLQLDYMEEVLELLEPLEHDKPTERDQRALVLARRGEALCAMARFDEADSLLRQAIALDDTIGWFHYLRGRALQNLERADQAHSAYQLAMERLPSDENFFERKGVANALYLQGQLEKAKPEYQRVIDTVTLRIPSPDADTLSLLGWCHYRLGEFDQALRLLMQALSLNPAVVSNQFDVSLVLLGLNRDEMAVREYQRAVEATRCHVISRRRGIFQVAINDLEVARREGRELADSTGAAKAHDLLEEAQNQTLRTAPEDGEVPPPRSPIHRDLRLARHRLPVPHSVREIPRVLQRRSRSLPRVIDDCPGRPSTAAARRWSGRRRSSSPSLTPVSPGGARRPAAGAAPSRLLRSGTPPGSWFTGRTFPR